MKNRKNRENRLIIILAIVAILISSGLASAENYVNFKGGFYFQIPEGWDKVDYRVVDYYLSYSDTSREVLNYEAVYAPLANARYMDQVYVVVTFDSLGTLSNRESDSILSAIASSYSRDIFDAPIVQMMTDLVPGKPRINRDQKAVSIMVDMAYNPESKKKLWQYMRLNDVGLISLYFYSPDSLFEEAKPVFDGIVSSLSFENLRQAASDANAVFTEVGRVSEIDDEPIDWDDDGKGLFGSGSLSQILVIAVIAIVIFGLIWNFVIRRKKTDGDSG